MFAKVNDIPLPVSQLLRAWGDESLLPVRSAMCRRCSRWMICLCRRGFSPSGRGAEIDGPRGVFAASVGLLSPEVVVFCPGLVSLGPGKTGV